MGAPVRVFCSYSHQDEDALNALKAHLSGLKRRGLITAWHDREIGPGTDWSRAIESALEEADLVLLLVSADFLASDYCNGVELTRALERARAGEARLIPIYVRPVYSTGEPFEAFQGMPEDKVPVYSWEDPDAGWVQVVRGIVAAAEGVLAGRGEGRPVPAAPASPTLAPRSDTGRRVRHLGGVAALLALVAIGIWRWWPSPDDSTLSARLSEGEILLDTGRYEQALEAYEAALKLDPDHSGAAYGRDKAEVLADRGPGFDVEAAHVRLRTLERAHPDDAHIHLMVGQLAAAGGDAAAARARFQRAVELDPVLPQAWFALGVLAHREGRLDEARADYGKAVEQAPSHRQYVTNLAGLLLDLGDYRAALDAYEGLLAVEQTLLLARLDAGNAARLAGDLGKAAWHHERLLRDLGRPGALGEGDNAAQWAFDLPQGEVTMDAPKTKRAYALLTVSLTRFLNGDEAGAREAADRAPHLPRTRAVLDLDLTRLEAARPEWGGRIGDFRRLVNPRQ